VVYCTAGWHYAFSGGLYIDGVRRGQRDRLRSGEVASDQGRAGDRGPSRDSDRSRHSVSPIPSAAIRALDDAPGTRLH